MFATFDQLAKFANDNEKPIAQDSATSSVDLSAIINRLNALEQRQNELLRKMENRNDGNDDNDNGQKLADNNSAESEGTDDGN